MSALPKALIDKITALPADRLAEVETFVDHLAQPDRDLVRDARTASAPAFAAVWTNPEDDAYDAL